MSVTDRSNAPSPTEPRPYHFPHITRTTLPNGLHVLVAENHNAPLVSFRALIRSGADHDTHATAGLASVTADLLDEGAGTRDTIGLAEDLGLLGAALGTGADWDASYISCDVLARTSEAALEIFSDVTARATLPTDGLERVRAERLNEILQQRDEPGVIAGKRFAHLLYGTGAYGNSVVGNADSVVRITIDDVRRFYEQHFVPNNSAVVVSGDVDSARAIELVTNALGGWKRGAEPPRAVIAPRPIDASRVYVIDRPQAVQSEIRVGHIGVSRSTEDYFALSVMNAIFGGVFNSRINLNLRERHGYTYGARSQFAFRRHAGPFVVAAPVRNEVTLQSVSEVLAELRRIRTGDIEDRELDDVKNYLMGVFPATVQTASDIASRLVDMELYGLPEDYFDRYRENIAGVSKKDVEQVAQKYLDPDRVLIVIVGNANQIREPLGTLGMPVHEMDIDGHMLPLS
ncbi:MAG TPA: pitrilysin family protein [Thermoanaerobaculia bacterium]|jgi:zinc protease|nr:pitrilysin family protein [Thermoanaerobaculia bacterium]